MKSNELRELSDEELTQYYHELIATYYNELTRETPELSAREIILRGYNNALTAWEAYQKDLMDTVARYDLKVETSSHYQPKEVITAYDVYKDIANLTITEANKDTVMYAKKLVRDFKRNDFQSRY